MSLCLLQLGALALLRSMMTVFTHIQRRLAIGCNVFVYHPETSVCQHLTTAYLYAAPVVDIANE